MADAGRAPPVGLVSGRAPHACLTCHHRMLDTFRQWHKLAACATCARLLVFDDKPSIRKFPVPPTPRRCCPQGPQAGGAGGGGGDDVDEVLMEHVAELIQLITEYRGQAAEGAQMLAADPDNPIAQEVGGLPVCGQAQRKGPIHGKVLTAGRLEEGKRRGRRL